MMNTESILALANYLKAEDYHFVTISPASHDRVMQRSITSTNVSAREVLGWNRPFKANTVDKQLLKHMQAADICDETAGLLKSKVRFSSLDNHLFLHSAYPTSETDAVFFGPDSYRFARFLKQTIKNLPVKNYERIVDIGAGTGVGGIVAAYCLQHRYKELIFADINPRSLEYAKINAVLASIDNITFCQSNLYSSIKAPVDLIIANPPYLVDSEARTYRHGGGDYGSLLSTRIVLEGLPMLSKRGALLLYTASPIVDGKDTFLVSITAELLAANCTFSYEEIDPDVFGEELLKEPYKQADRIAAVALVVIKSSH